MIFLLCILHQNRENTKFNSIDLLVSETLTFKLTHRLGRPHYVWDEYLYSVLEEVRLGWLYVCLCSVIVLVGWWWWKEERRWNPVPTHSLLFSKSTKGAVRLNVPIRRTNRYQQYYMRSRHTYCARVWNLIQAPDVQSSDWKVYISTPPSREVENFQMKIYDLAGDRTPDPLNKRQACYHLSRAAGCNKEI